MGLAKHLEACQMVGRVASHAEEVARTSSDDAAFHTRTTQVLTHGVAHRSIQGFAIGLPIRIHIRVFPGSVIL